MLSLGIRVGEGKGERVRWGDFWSKGNCIFILGGGGDFCETKLHFCFVKKQKINKNTILFHKFLSV